MSVPGSFVYWLFLGLSAPLLYLVALCIWAATALRDPRRSLVHRYTCWWSRLYLECLPGCRLLVNGRERLQPGIAYVLTANHQNATDIMALGALGIPFKWVSKKEVFRIPFIGWNMILNQYVSVDRGNMQTLRRTLQECKHWLSLGVSLLMFPEGTRSRTGEISPFHRGAFHLAVECGCPVVPIVVEGTYGLYRGFHVRLFPGTIQIRILDPITIEEAGGSVETLKNLAYKRMRETQEELRKARVHEGHAVGV